MTHLSGQERAAYVQDMFGRIAARYNLMNRLMTFGQDMKSRRFVARQANLKAGDKLLDLATGTGDIAFEALKASPGIQVVGGDFSLPMMRVGMKLPFGDKIGWAGADALNLPFPDETFNAVTSGYLARNVIDIPRMFAEQLRVLKPGGHIVVLDSSPPKENLLLPFIEIHLRYVIPTLGRIIAGKSGADAYKYLPASTQAFKSPDELANLMRAAGIKNVHYKTFMFGTMAVHWGIKQPLPRIWELRKADVLLGRLAVVEQDMFWTTCGFEPTDAFEAYKQYWYPESVPGSSMDDKFRAWQTTITELDLRLVNTETGESFRPGILHINDEGGASFRRGPG